MKRIGVAASRIAKDNYWLYHLYVILISSMMSLLLFLVVGLIVVFALAILNYVGTELIGQEYHNRQETIVMICMAALAVVTLFFNLFAILINLRFPAGSK